MAKHLGSHGEGARVTLGIWQCFCGKVHLGKVKPPGHQESLGRGEKVTVIRNAAKTTGVVTVRYERTGAIVERDGYAPLFEAFWES